MARDREESDKLLGPLESEVMEIIWSSKRPMTVRELVERINDGRPSPLAYTTVMTVMSRLVDKGALTRRREGRGYLYEATGSDRAGIAVRNVIRQFGDSAVAHFVDEARADPQTLRRLRRLLRDDS
jgi:predicted transcriptional regulator